MSTARQLNERYDEHMQALIKRYNSNNSTPLYLKKGTAFNTHSKFYDRVLGRILPRGKVQNALLDAVVEYE